MFYILYGQDNFSLHQSMEDIKGRLGDPEMLAVNTSVFDGQQLKLNQLKDACSIVPFLCPSRLIIVKDLLKRFEPGPPSKRRTNRSQGPANSKLEEWRMLGDYVKQVPSTTALVLIDGKVSNKNPLLKSLLPLAKVMTFPLLSGKRLSNWIQKQVNQSGGSVSPGAVGLLAELVGGDLWSMRNEIDKLLAYSSGCLITEDDVKKVTSYAREATIFALVDAIVEGRIKAAQQLLHQLLQEGISPAYVMAMITRQFGLIIRVMDMGKLTRLEIQKKSGLTSGYVLDKALKQAKTYSPERVKRTYHKLLETDIAIKTGKYDEELALGLLVVELCRD